MPSKEFQKELNQKKAALFAPPSEEELTGLDAPPTAEELSSVQTAKAPTLKHRAAGVAIGAAESFNPLTILKDVETVGRAAFGGKGELEEVKPHGPLGIPLAKPKEGIAESLVRGSKESVMPSLTVKEAIGFIPGTKDFLEAIPPGAEALGGAAGLLIGGVKGARGLIKGGKARQSVKQTEKLIQDYKWLTGEAEGPVMDAFLKRPENVKEILKSGKLSVDDLAVQLGQQLDQKKKLLGDTVGSFREIAKSDVKPSINVSKEVQRLNRIEDELKTSAGVSALSESELKEVNEIRRLLPEFTKKGGAKITPRDAVIITDKIGTLLDRSAAKPGMLQEGVLFELRELRRNIKQAARESTGVAKEWADADKVYSEFVDLSGDIQNKLSSDQRASFIDNLLSKNKDPIRDRLTKALNLAELEDEGQVFWNQLADMKAAQGLKAIDVTKADPIRDQANRLFQKWIRRGQDVGGAAGALAGGGVGSALGIGGGAVGIGGGGIGGAFIGEKLGRAAGGFFGDVVGRRMASPFALLDRAENVKILSKEAKEMAKDLGFIGKHFGIEGANLFANSYLAGRPALMELSRWLEAQK